MSQSTITWRRIGPGHYVGLGGPLPEELGGGRRAYRIDRRLQNSFTPGYYYWVAYVNDGSWLVNSKPNGDPVNPLRWLTSPENEMPDEFRTLNDAKQRAVEYEEADED